MRSALLLAVLALPCAAAASSPSFDDVSVGLKVDDGRETGERSFSWGPTVEADLVTSSTRAATRFKYGVQLGYGDERTKITTGELTPYVAGGVQYVDSRQDADDERVNQFYWSPIIGVGVELALTKRTLLALDWEQPAGAIF